MYGTEKGPQWNCCGLEMFRGNVIKSICENLYLIGRWYFYDDKLFQ